MNGVILDCDSLGPDSLDLSPLHNLPISWTLYPDCSDQQVAERITDADIVLTNKAMVSASAINQAPRLKLFLLGCRVALTVPGLSVWPLIRF